MAYYKYYGKKVTIVRRCLICGNGLTTVTCFGDFICSKTDVHENHLIRVKININHLYTTNITKILQKYSCRVIYSDLL